MKVVGFTGPQAEKQANEPNQDQFDPGHWNSPEQ